MKRSMRATDFQRNLGPVLDAVLRGETVIVDRYARCQFVLMPPTVAVDADQTVPSTMLSRDLGAVIAACDAGLTVRVTRNGRAICALVPYARYAAMTAEAA